MPFRFRRLPAASPLAVMAMRKLIHISIIVAIFCGLVFFKNPFASECQNVEGQIFIRNGWPPWIRIESSDKQNMFGIETNEEITKSDFMPEGLLKELQSNESLTGTFCITLTGDQTTVRDDARVIKYVKVVSYKIK